MIIGRIWYYCLLSAGGVLLFPFVGHSQEEEPPVYRAVPVQRPPLRGIPVESSPPRAIPVRPATAVATPVPVPPRAIAVRPAIAVTPALTPTPTPAATLAPVVQPMIRKAIPVAPAPRATPVATPTPVVVQPPVATPRPTRPPGVSDDSSTIRIAPQAPDARAVTRDEVQFKLANSLYSKKHYNLAIPEFEKYLVRFPGGHQRAAAFFRQAECYRLLRIKRKARETYRQLLLEFRRGEFAGSAAYRLAEMATKSNDYESAAYYFEKAGHNLGEQKLKLASRFREARSLDKLGRSESARAAYKKVIAVEENNPYYEASMLALAKLASNSGRKNEAFRYYDQLAATTTKADVRAEAAVNAGVLGGELGKTQRAAGHFEKVLAMPGAGKWRNIARLGLLRLAYQEGQYEEVIQTYTADPSEIAPDLRAEALLLVANSHRQLGDHAQAATIYQQIITDYSDSRFAQDAEYQRLISLYSTNDPGLLGALDSYLATTSSSSKADQARLLKAETLYKNGDFAAAAAAYEQLVQSSLDAKLKSDVLYKLGWCKAKTNDPAGAINAYTAFLAEYPENARTAKVTSQRGLLYQQRGDFDAANTDFNDVIANFHDAPERAVALQQKALILGQKKNNAGMAATFKKLLASYPDTAASAQAHYWIGWVAFEDKKYPDAIPSLGAARKADPDKYYERASLRIILANYYMEKFAATMVEVEDFLAAERQKMLPAQILLWLGTEAFAANDFAASERMLTELTARENPVAVPVTAWLTLAKALNAQRKWQRAVEALQPCLTGLKENADKAAAYLALAQAQLGLLDFAATQTAIDEVLALQPEGILNARARMVGGEIQMKLNQFDAAAKSFQRIALLYDDYEEIAPQALERAHAALVQLGDPDKASEVMNELRSRYPEHQL